MTGYMLPLIAMMQQRYKGLWPLAQPLTLGTVPDGHLFMLRLTHPRMTPFARLLLAAQTYENGWSTL